MLANNNNDDWDPEMGAREVIPERIMQGFAAPVDSPSERLGPDLSPMLAPQRSPELPLFPAPAEPELQRGESVKVGLGSMNNTEIMNTAFDAGLEGEEMETAASVLPKGQVYADEINIKLTAYKASGFGNIVKMEISEPIEEMPRIENEIQGELINKTNQSDILSKITSKFDNTKFAEGFAFDPKKDMKYTTSSLAGKVTTAREAWAALSSWALKNQNDAKYSMVIEFMEWLNTQVGTEWRMEDFNGQNAHDLYRSIIKPELLNNIKPVSAKQTIYNATDDKSTIMSKLEELKEELRKGNTTADNQKMDIDDAKREIESGDATEKLLKGILKNIAELNSKHLKNGILYAPNKLFGVSKDAFRRNELKNFIVKKRMFGYGGKTQRCGFKGGARKTKKSKSGRKTRRCRK